MVNRILISGFEPFAQQKKNVSGEFANWINTCQFEGTQTSRFSELDFRGIQLPVVYAEAAQKLLRELQIFKAQTVVMFGIADGRTKIGIEKYAHNFADSLVADNCGQILSGQIIDQGPSALQATIDVDRLNSEFNRAQMPAEISRDAGSYVCNDTYYRVLAALRWTPIRVGFVHLPVQSWDFRTLIEILSNFI